MKTTINKFQPEGNFFFLVILIGVIVLAVISLFSSPGFTTLEFGSGRISLLLDSLNSGSSVYFDFGKYELKPESYRLLDSLAEALKLSPYATLEISGYTDNIGSDEFNLNLSEKRAETVKNYLISKGCPEEQIIIKAKGKLESSTDENVRAYNRKVDFKWLNNVTESVMPKDEEFVNSNFRKKSQDELEGEISARDTSGDPVKGLEEKDVKAMLKWETDSAEGSVHFLPIDEKKKIAFTLVLDYSPSMFAVKQYEKVTPKSDKVLQMESAVKSFISVLGQNMFVKIIKFGGDIDVVQRFTKSKEVMLKAVDLRSYPRGGTALFASIYTALIDTMYDSNPTIMKTVITFTDGMDNQSHNITKDSIYLHSNENGVKVYTIGLLDVNDNNSTIEERKWGEDDLKEIARKTGGFFYKASESGVLQRIYNQIFNQITNSYRVSIKWDKEKLPPKGTKVTARINVNVNGKIRTFFKDYVME